MGVFEFGLVYFIEDYVKLFIKQFLEGLSYCYYKNFFYRDIKCFNILLSNKYVFCILFIIIIGIFMIIIDFRR